LKEKQFQYIGFWMLEVKGNHCIWACK